MKILFVGYHNTEFISITEYIQEAIFRSGHEFIIFDDRKFIIPRKIRRHLPTLQRIDLRRINHKLLSLADEHRPDICLVTGGHRILPETIIKLKRRGIPTALWTIDAPVDFGPVIKAAPYYDYIFCGGSEAIELLTKEGVKNLHWLPFACSPTFHHPIDVSKHKGDDYKYDVVFVGSYYPNRAEILRGLVGLNLGIWGPGWERIHADDPLFPHIRGGALKPEEWVKVYNEAKIVLVVHYQDGKTLCYQASPKVYEAMACHRLVLCDDQKDVNAQFQNGKHLVVFSSGADLKAKVVQYLSDPNTREAIAKQGYEEIQRKHSYQHRIQEMLVLLLDQINKSKEILFVGYHNKNFKTITEYTESAIVSLGHRLKTADYRDWLIPGRIRNCVPSLHKWDMDRINRNLIQDVKRIHPDLLLVNGGWTIYPQTIAKIKKENRIITVNWIADYPSMFDKYLIAGPCYDYFFTSGTDSLLKYKEAGHQNGYWLPFACYPQIHRPLELTEREKKEYSCDICFVGSYYTERVEILEHLSEFNLGIWGTGWEKLSPRSPLRKHIRGGSLQPEEWVKCFNAAKIVLNIIGHRCDVMEPFVPEGEFRMTNTKVFEILGCGAFQMVDDKADVTTLFKDREHLVTYKDGPDLVKLIKYYLKNNAERTRIADQGRREVVNRHTYQYRLKEILSVISQGR